MLRFDAVMLTTVGLLPSALMSVSVYLSDPKPKPGAVRTSIVPYPRCPIGRDASEDVRIARIPPNLLKIGGMSFELLCSSHVSLFRKQRLDQRTVRGRPDSLLTLRSGAHTLTVSSPHVASHVPSQLQLTSLPAPRCAPFSSLISLDDAHSTYGS